MDKDYKPPIDQQIVDAKRIIDTALMFHDEDTLNLARTHLEKIYGTDQADNILCGYITHKIGAGKFAFVDDEGNVSDLI